MMEFYILSQSQAAAGLLGSRLWDRVVTESGSTILRSAHGARRRLERYLCIWTNVA